MAFTLPKLSTTPQYAPDSGYFDKTLLWVFLGFLMIGVVMVFSASVMDPDYLALNPADRIGKTPDMLHFLKSDLKNVVVSLGTFFLALCIPMKIWNEKLRSPLFLVSLFLLALLALGVGRSINGAVRWIPLGFMNFQPAELSKLALICFLASYIARRYEEVRNKQLSLVKPVGVTLLFAILLSRQPDTGTAVVLFAITIGMFFLAGVKILQMLVAVSIGLGLLGLTIWLNPYKLARVTNFLDPFEDPYSKGYQLSNSLIAFGRGEIFGEGLGNSVQKLAYLPEPHTDFILSVVGEELGFVGVVGIIVLFALLIWKAIKICKDALQSEQRFAGFFASGIATWFFCQGTVNLGAALGILPTKGLTFPFMSYGGSSLMMMSVALAILLRIDYENRLHYFSQQGENLDE